MTDWKQITITPDTLLGDAIAKVDAGGIQLALVVDDDGRLAGILGDGDIRRAILRGMDLTTRCAEVMNSRPITALVTTPNDALMALMRRHLIHQVPLLDDDGLVAGLVTLDEMIGAVKRPNWVVLMAGGLGSRLRPLTVDCPKPLLSVGGKPILENILDSFVEKGFRQFFFSVNYKAEMICEYFGNGERWGVQIQYLRETIPLGTAGALSLLPQPPDAPLIVMNGDLLTRANFDDILQFHIEHSAAATMAVREYDFQVPYGVVRIDGSRISTIEEKPIQRFLVNAGIYVISPQTLKQIPVGKYYDMPTFFESLTATGLKTVAYPMQEYWLDIGRLEEFERAQQEWFIGVRLDD